jgi:hypothetical protein
VHSWPIATNWPYSGGVSFPSRLGHYPFHILRADLENPLYKLLGRERGGAYWISAAARTYLGAFFFTGRFDHKFRSWLGAALPAEAARAYAISLASDVPALADVLEAHSSARRERYPQVSAA